MSKSLGNFYTLRDLLNMGYQPETIRYLLASVPYRKKLNFTFEGLKAAARSIERLRDFELRLATTRLGPGSNDELSERSREAIRHFEESMDDDLNTAEALAAVFEYVRTVNTAIDESHFLEENRWEAAKVLETFDRVFDVLKRSETLPALNGEVGLPQEPSPTDREIEALIEERTQAKKSRNFQRSDEIRKELAEQGVILEDTKDGVRWKRK
jgi:cysteinyl-tRNA synthetase